MALSENKAVRKAYADGEYTDAQGFSWYRGMDGWFLDMGENGRMLSYHHTFVEMIENEHPDE